MKARKPAGGCGACAHCRHCHKTKAALMESEASPQQAKEQAACKTVPLSAITTRGGGDLALASLL
ncbi:hypothetical protein AGMMS49545_01210 [Betaproteobacteria bacterium]|nr:hypothetical protein AGMMS49545_01210 [Betaproteobacteria bacterium]